MPRAPPPCTARFGRSAINAPYLIDNADFIACHNFTFLEKYDMLSKAKPGGTFLLCSPFAHDVVWDRIPKEVQQQIIDKQLKFYVINAIKLGEELGLGARINVIMQTAFFRISNIIPLEQAVNEIKGAIKKSYGKAGEKVVTMNNSAVDEALKNIHEVAVLATATGTITMPPPVSKSSPQFVQEVTGKIIAGFGDDLPVRLHLNLRRQPPHNPLGQACRRPRPGLVQLPLRGQRRVRFRHASGGGQVH